ncbi:MAG: NAD(P)-dependent glycerol-3-phosphate dehydrogenase [Erysipelotrichaceae bacterium]|nr:NAD(P)-dependent glycerol-3-phosphate dehydrogenase [Erysipelotrichaceae bacterium]
MKVIVIGAGSWGTALGNVLADNGSEVVIYGRNQTVVDEINNMHTNSRYFEDCQLNRTITATTEISAAEGKDMILLSVPSRECINVTREIKPYVNEKNIIVNVAKGFEPKSYRLLSKCICEELDNRCIYAALLGPSHAEEVVLRKHTTVNICCENDEIACMLQKEFSNEYFRVYRNNDLIGCQYGAGLKNIIAIASGILYGLDLGDNAKASLMTRGLAEMSRLGVMMGGKKETFMGLCGMGDLIVTCTSHFSRNWQAGYQIGRDDSAEEFWKTNTKTVEGVDACRIIKHVADEKQVSMPITQELYKVLFEKKRPSEAINDLMTRTLKSE